MASLTDYARTARRHVAITYTAEAALLLLAGWLLWDAREYSQLATIPLYAPLGVALGFVVGFKTFEIALPANPAGLHQLAKGEIGVVAGWLVGIGQPVAGAACMTIALGWWLAYRSLKTRVYDERRKQDGSA